MRSSRAYLIAEAGVNHNGSLDRALALIDAAVAAGADSVKFQTFKAEAVISRHAVKAEYQIQTTGAGETQLEMAKKLELDSEAHKILFEHCRKRSIQFLSTPFDLGSIDFLADHLDVPILKIPSGEVTNAPFLLKIARTGKPLIFSTGMSTLEEVRLALGVLAFGYTKPAGAKPSPEAFDSAYRSAEGQTVLSQRVTLLHCTTEYPAPFEDVNLRAMDTLKEAFNLKVGLSDHSRGIHVAIAAVARGAAVIEKHFTLDRNLPGPDHQASLEPEELAAMVRAIREVELSLGSGEKKPAASELKNLPIARRSLVAAKAIQAGEKFSEENLTIKRPGVGVSPMNYWKFIGKKSTRDYQPDELILDLED